MSDLSSQTTLDSFLRINGIAAYDRMLIADYLEKDVLVKAIDEFNNEYKGISHHRIGTKDDFFHGHLLRSSKSKDKYILFHTQEEIIGRADNNLSILQRSYIINVNSHDIKHASEYVTSLDRLSAWSCCGTVHASDLDKLTGFFQVEDMFEFYSVPCHFYENWEISNGQKTSLFRLDDNTCLNLLDFGWNGFNSLESKKSLIGKRYFLVKSHVAEARGRK